MKSLAFFSPLSPLRSGVAHYGDALAAELCRHYRLNFYIENDYEPTEIDGLGDVRLHSEYRGEEDMTLYQASNGILHAYMYPYLLEGGAVMTLHDQTLHDMALNHWEKGTRRAKWRDFFQNEGMAGFRKLIKPIPPTEPDPFGRVEYNLYRDENNKRMGFTFLKRAVRSARGIIAHSTTVQNAVRSKGAECPVMVTPLAVETAPDPEDRAIARSGLGLEKAGIDKDTFVVLAYGFIQGHKRIEVLLDVWKQYCAIDPKARLILLGSKNPTFHIDDHISRRGLGDHVFIDDSFPPMKTVNRYLFAADLCVNLRYPVYGSSSYSLMQIMAAGRPCVVTNVETFAEFDDGLVIKVPYGGGEPEALLDVFRHAKENPDDMEAIGKKARRYIERECTWPVVGERYRRFLEEIYG